MKKHYSLLLSCHTPESFSVDVLMTVSLTDSDEKLLLKLSSVKRALSIMIDASRHWAMAVDMTSAVAQLAADRVAVMEHSQSYLRSQLKKLIPLKLLDASQEYLVDLTKLDKETAAQCIQVFNKVDNYREERLAALEQEEQKLAVRAVHAVVSDTEDKLAVLVAETAFLNIRLLPEIVLDNLAVQFNEEELLSGLRHRGGVCLTLVKDSCTTQLSWQAALVV